MSATHNRVPYIFLFLSTLCGCGPQPTRSFVGSSDTSFLRDFAQTRGYSAGQPAGVQVTPDGSAVVFLRSGPRDVVRNLYEMNARTGEVRGLLRAEELLQGAEEKLTAEEKARRERMRVTAKGFAWFQMSEDGSMLLVSISGDLFVVHRPDGKVTPLPKSPSGAALDAHFSPDGRFVSCIHGHDVYVIDIATGQETAVTSGGTEDVSHGVAEFVAQEEMDRRSGYWWSGDSQWLAFQETDQRDVEKLYVADARNPQAAPDGWRYPRAGKSNAKVRLGIVSVTGGAPKWVDWDHDRYPYMAGVHWGKDGPLTVFVQSRNQHEAALYLVDPQTGTFTELVKETDPAWINIDADMPRWLAGQQEFLWTSERTGEWEIELRRRDGSLVRTLPHGRGRLQDVVAVDLPRREMIVRGSDDPTQSQLSRVAIDGGDVVALTDGRGSHGGIFSKNGNMWVESISLFDGGSRQVVRARDASVLHELPSVAEAPPFLANVELTTVDIAGRTLHAALVRPRAFNPLKKYPVIASVYGGPHSNVVASARRAYLRQQWLADHGFILVSIDGRGTMHRGREWERAIYRDLIDPALDDQVAGLQALGRKYRELDLSRVGVFGWSFGGYFSAMAVLKRPDVFHCAVAGAPVIDWQDYDTHYTERYMGLPQENAEAYKKCSALTYAARLQRPLLLIHGTTDDNVYFLHSLKMSEALFRAGRSYDLLVLPGFTHMVPEPEVTIRLNERIARHFQKYLVENPPKPHLEGVES